jgi:hypothetical protein
VTMEPAEALSSLNEALGTVAWLIGSAVTVAVLDGPAAENSSARAVRTAK